MTVNRRLQAMLGLPGVLRYVDAGHGDCAIRRPDGALTRLSQRSLVVFSDGLVERGEQVLDMGVLGVAPAARRRVRPALIPGRPGPPVSSVPW
jgi:hypothetical protein